MAEYRNDADERVVVVEKKRGAGTTIAILLLIAAVIVGLLFATGFWSANVTKSGALPQVSVKGGEMPSVDMDSKAVVVGTTNTTVEVPKVKTEKETVSVPTIGVQDDGKK